MTTTTDFSAVDESGHPILADAYGNNVAFRCLGCGGPVLAALFQSHKGTDASHPSKYRAGGCAYWVEPAASDQRLIIHRLEGKR